MENRRILENGGDAEQSLGNQQISVMFDNGLIEEALENARQHNSVTRSCMIDDELSNTAAASLTKHLYCFHQN